MSFNVRECIVMKRSDFEGYGFNLHSENGKLIQYIGHVEPESPAYTSGLLKNDVVIEVNGANIIEEQHQEVVNRIKADSSQVCLLVIDNDGFEYCSRENIRITRDMINSRDSENYYEKNVDTSMGVTADEPMAAYAAPSYNEHRVTTSYNDRDNNSVHSGGGKLNLADLSAEEIRSRTAESAAKKKANRKNQIPFKDRAQLFQQL